MLGLDFSVLYSQGKIKKITSSPAQQLNQSDMQTVSIMKADNYVDHSQRDTIY